MDEAAFFAVIPVSEGGGFVGDGGRTIGVGGFKRGHEWALQGRPLGRAEAAFALFIETE